MSYYPKYLGVFILWCAIASGLDLSFWEMVAGSFGVGLLMPTKEQYDRFYWRGEDP